MFSIRILKSAYECGYWRTVVNGKQVRYFPGRAVPRLVRQVAIRLPSTYYVDEYGMGFDGPAECI